MKPFLANNSRTMCISLCSHYDLIVLSLCSHYVPHTNSRSAQSRPRTCTVSRLRCLTFHSAMAADTPSYHTHPGGGFKVSKHPGGTFSKSKHPGGYAARASTQGVFEATWNRISLELCSKSYTYLSTQGVSSQTRWPGVKICVAKIVAILGRFSDAHAQKYDDTARGIGC